MLDELTKALGPWPILQLVLGIAVLGAGIWAVMRGTQGKDGEKDISDKRAEWAAYEQLRNIEENSSKIVASQEKMVEIVNRIAAILWNRGQGG
jgi:hypothetical protein